MAQTTQQKTSQPQTSKQQPFQTLRLGAVKCVIWQNETSAGPRHNLTFAKLFKKDNRWRETHSFSRDDLPLLQQLAEDAYRLIDASTETSAATAR